MDCRGVLVIEKDAGGRSWLEHVEFVRPDSGEIED
jgi:hypothetical protein